MAAKWWRRAATLCALLVLLVCAGCSVRKLAYGWAGKLLASRIADTFDLSASQKHDLLPRIASLHKWHRQVELPRYVALLDAIREKARDGLDASEVEWLLAEGGALVERLSARFSPEAGLVLSTLSDAQIEHAVSEFKKGERERFEKLELPEEEYVKYRLKLARKNLKTWLGSYSDAQLAEFERFVRKNRLEELRRRKRYQENEATLLAALRAHPGPAPLAKLVHSWLTQLEVEVTPEYQAAERRSRADFVELVLAVDRLTTAEQRRHFLEELRLWRTDFYELANGL